MTNSNIQLDHNLYRRFVDALLQLSVTDTFEGRSSLLEGLPRIALTRSQTNSRLDLNQIISGFVRLGQDRTTGMRPLIVIAENAMQYIQGWEGELNSNFQEIIQELELYYGSKMSVQSVASPEPEKLPQHKINAQLQEAIKISDRVSDNIRPEIEEKQMKVFISHSTIDKPFVERLATDLRVHEGIDVWLDKWEILPGDNIPAKLEEALKSASVFVLVLSPDSINSRWVSYEKDSWLTAQINEEKSANEESRTPNRRLIPVLYQDCEKPFFLQSILHVSINDQNYKNGFQELVQGIRRESSKPPLRGDSNTISIPPLLQKEIQSSVPSKKLALNLLKSLISSQFDEVIFSYDISQADLPGNGTQVQKAIAVIQIANQKEGESLPKLINTIYEVVPQLKR